MLLRFYAIDLGLDFKNYFRSRDSRCFDLI